MWYNISMKILILVLALMIAGCSAPSDKAQIKDFMLSDNTSENVYSTGVERYTCGYFARDVVLNAREQGFEAYRVIITWEGCASHAIVLFKTDSGDIYVDATQGDWWVEIKDGRYYSWSMTDESFHSWWDMPIIDYFIDERL